MSKVDPLPPGSTIGILGGGQLARMLALAAASLGLKCQIFTPEQDSPAAEVSSAATVGAFDDEAALARFAESVDAVTYEFENVPSRTAAFLAGRRPLHPSAEALAITQDRLSEKRFVNGLAIETAPFAPVDDEASLADALAAIGLPAILKTRRLGYDGKGQVMLRSREEAAAAWAGVRGAPSVLEGLVPFAAELSVVAVRGKDGPVSTYDITENEHRHHILHVSRVPARFSEDIAGQARDIAERIAAGLDYVGVLAVEMFLVEEDEGSRLVVNEIAPRVHNSGHWTIEACRVSQFENHIRAVAGWPLGSTRRHADAEMTNLLGDDIDQWLHILADETASLHLYGKREARPGRKMGHVTRWR